MDIKLTAPSAIHGEIHLPFSKSISNRVLLLNKLSKNTLEQFLKSMNEMFGEEL